MRFSLSTLSIAMLSLSSTAVFSQESLQATTVLNTIVTEASALDTVGKTVYSKEDLKKIPNTNKNITDFLKVNPNVQFGQATLAAGSQGELKPSEISINGAQTFQNNFIINGVSNNLLINPTTSGGNAYNTLSSGAQGIAINTDLLCELEVLDSNVSAAYGQFTGGVVSAKECEPETEIGKIHGSISYDFTDSAWARYNAITPLEEELFEEPDETNQSEYTKQGISATLYGKLSEKWGFNSSLSKRQSVIPVISGFETPKKIDQKRNNTNVGTTLFYTASEDLKAKFGFNYGLIDNLGYTSGRRNSKTTIETESYTIFSELEHRIGSTKLTHKLNFQSADNQRLAENSTGFIWHYAEGSKDWTNSSTVSEGTAIGDLQQKQSSYSYSIDGLVDAFKIANIQNTVRFGAGYSHTDVVWDRPREVMYANSGASKDLKNAQCLADDWLCDQNKTIQGWNGQYIESYNIYKPGHFTAQQDRFHVYAEDELELNNLSTRFGVRGDYDSLNGKFNIAPRSSVSYKPFSNDKLQLLGGWNRYYGSKVLSTELNELMAQLNYKAKRADSQSEWVESFGSNSGSTRSSKLDTPYSDETSLAINSRISNIDIGLKWVHRLYKDEISRTYTSIPQDGMKFSYEYANDGHGKADIYTLSIKNHEALQLWNTKHHLSLAMDFSDIYRSYNDYTSNYNDTDQDRLISYAGKIMQWSERPAQNFNQPWTARVNWDIELEHLPIKFTNYLRYKDSYDDMISGGKVNNPQGTGTIDSYIANEIKSKFNWDLRATYDQKLSKNLSVIYGLTVNNVTNRVNTYTTLSTAPTRPRVMTEIGRQFIADVSFKF